MVKITWNPLQYPQAGDIVGWPRPNLAGQREVITVTNTSFRGVEILYRPIDEKGVFGKPKRVVRRSWARWCYEARPNIIKGGSRDTVDGIEEKFEIAKKLLREAAQCDVFLGQRINDFLKDC